ncbi:4-hydroxybenzoate 3-monooxygenase [Marmoricola endophyticus]|uniref:4-hydroxybenzoate 3-monooxygenase n=1 Tax=Marmoricola endophyticus TaxID=2040280 RepID=A0A917F399_9ACTN|nr:4-hydroxybenzoate 3-monooxygenase [Marmoricola endophyticus]GGF44640.1 4-hydroxybenzoate 3-monooxygenase [Marmoricola endophyticus]
MSERTQVGILGAGPAGLLLSHLLHRAGIESVVVDTRTREEIEQTHRAGILEQGSVDVLVESGVSDRVLREGRVHEGIDLRFGGTSHRIDFAGLVGATTTLYPQTEVFVDLADARERDGGDVRFGVREGRVADVTGDRPVLSYVDGAGTAHTVGCDVVVGADGSRSETRRAIPGLRRYSREYPFAWFGILTEAPPSAEELIYARSPHGFALISQRTDDLQRMYFQCDADEDPSAWSDDRIWSELQARVAGDDGLELRQGPIVERTVLPFRSTVSEPMRHGSLLLAGDAAHTVPPTGAKGLNLALADVRVLAEVLERALGPAGRDALDDYTPRALGRVWKAQHFSYWMTTMLHTAPQDTDFDERRRLGELAMVTGSTAGSTYLAEAYTGWPGLR